MTLRQKKDIIGLRDYYKYLNARFAMDEIAIIDISEWELKRMTRTRDIYIRTFKYNPGFSRWLFNIKPKVDKKGLNETDKKFYKITILTINRILRSEGDGLSKN